MIQTIRIHNLNKPLDARRISRRFCGPYEWTPATPGKGRGFYSDSDNQFEMGEGDCTFRLRIHDANDFLGCARIAHILGYWCDYDGFDSLRPIVARLPHSRAFLAGWTMGAGMCGSLDAGLYPDAESAAFAAHSMAEYDAEAEREYQANIATQEATTS